jgi:TPR repeat protein
MSVKKLIWVLGLSVLLAACSTNNYLAANSPAWRDNSARNMGVRHLLGRGVEQNDVKAFNYFTKAATQGDVLAQNELAYLYAAGRGTPRNNKLAFEWYKKAASSGLSSAQYNLGLMYLRGVGTAADKTLAMEWFKKSAGQGFAPAQAALSQNRA